VPGRVGGKFIHDALLAFSFARREDSLENVGLKVSDIARLVSEFAPEAYSYPWDRRGLRVGDPSAKVKGILVVLSVTPAALAAARKAKANLIVAHHPPVWEPLKVLRMDDPETRLLVEMARDGIHCYAAHTNLDVVPGGVNTVLADRIGLKATRVLFPAPHAAMLKLIAFVPATHLGAVREAVCAAGAGVIGDYTHCSFSSEGIGTFLPGEGSNPFSGKKRVVNEEPERKFEVLLPKARLSPVLAALFEAHPYEEVAYDLVPLENTAEGIGLGLIGEMPKAMPLNAFAKHVRERLGVSHVRLAGARVRRVKTVAVLGGSGGGEIGKVPAGVDAYVTGDVKYHDALLAEDKGFAVVDAGHHGTEAPMIPVWADWLRKRLQGSGISVKAYAEPETFRVVSS